jgi:hypothetical protein
MTKKIYWLSVADPTVEKGFLAAIIVQADDFRDALVKACETNGPRDIWFDLNDRLYRDSPLHILGEELEEYRLDDVGFWFDRETATEVSRAIRPIPGTRDHWANICECCAKEQREKGN